MIILNNILKSRDISSLTKVCIVKVMLFPVVMYGCESRTIKKAEHWGTDVFKLRCCRRLLRVPWTSRGSNQSIKEINPEYWLEGLMLKLKFPYFGHLMQKTLMLGKIEGRRKRGWQRMTWAWVDFRNCWWTGRPGVLQFIGSWRVGHDWETELTDWPVKHWQNF